eukprot:TRINITY_DN51882_c0_g1_i1.p1 TRINITY_DN51882_c0_g1~~TRINITY_DN51882_c0_g1_i1.p1  ORF type:complete len:767 (-),score=126.71 TRINITY_DN51882_c0_g1_i1:188-2488(-)
MAAACQACFAQPLPVSHTNCHCSAATLPVPLGTPDANCVPRSSRLLGSTIAAWTVACVSRWRCRHRHCCSVGRDAEPLVLPEPELSTPRGAAVVWFRTGDLRVGDHPGLAQAAVAPGGTVCCYFFETCELARLSPRRLAALHAAVEALRSELKRRFGAALQVSVADDAAAEVYRLCQAVEAGEVFVQEDPGDLNVASLSRLKEFCSETDVHVSTWRAPLRLQAGSLGSTCRANDSYSATVVELPRGTPLACPNKLKVEESRGIFSESASFPDLASLQSAASSSGVGALRQSVPYVPGLGAPVSGEEEAQRLLSIFTKGGSEALAHEAWGPPQGEQTDMPASKEEWAFRRVACADGYKGLISGEVFSRVLSEQMLWLGCISLRTVALALERMKDHLEDRDTALKALEANEWHRLLALADLTAEHQRESSESSFQYRYYRWRGYLLRYLAPASATSFSCSECTDRMQMLPPVLAVHGFAASCSQFAPLAQVLGSPSDTSSPVRLYALDMLGFGHAEKPPLSITQYVWEQCVKDFLLSVVGEPAVIMGNSIGGYMAQSVSAYLGPRICRGVVLMNSAGPLFPAEDYTAALQRDGGTVLQRMRQGYGGDAGLPDYSPPPQWLVDFGAWALFSGLQPNIAQILKSLYPSNEEPVQRLAEEILRDSKDPFAANVIASFTRLGPSRSTNELLEEYATADGEGQLLVCQGMADRLGGGPDNQPKRMELFTSAVPRLPARAVQLQGCGHCPHHEAPLQVAQAVRSWLQEEVCAAS